MRVFICRGTMQAANQAAQCLQSAGHRVVGCAMSKNVDTEQMKHSTADVVLLDAYMPQPDGYAIEKAIQPLACVLIKGDLQAAVRELECLSDRVIEPEKISLIRNELMRFGFRMHTKGAQQMLEAVIRVVQDERRIEDLKHSVYPSVAEKCGGTAASVERSLRYTIESVWTRGDLAALQACFGYTIDAERGKPTNKAFLAQMAEHIRHCHA